MQNQSVIPDEVVYEEDEYLTPAQAVRKHCIQCVGNPSEVESCGGQFIYNTGLPCPLYLYRFGKGRVPLSVIKQECKNCMGGSMADVRECGADCYLQPFRLGKNLHIILSDEEKERSAARLKSAHHQR